MADVMELLDHIRREQDNFPAAQKKVAAFVVENYQQIAFLPISALSQRVGVRQYGHQILQSSWI